jgi:hypothetical protein
VFVVAAAHELVRHGEAHAAFGVGHERQQERLDRRRLLGERDGVLQDGVHGTSGSA